jgi:cytochrome c oxidase assembly factor CtaG
VRVIAAAAGLLIGFSFDDAAFAHAVVHGEAQGLVWNWEPNVMVPLGIAALWYELGVWRLRRELGDARVISPTQVICFVAGIAILFVALVSPVDTVGAELFSVHMVQHLLLTLAAPPLLVLSRPAIAFLWAFPVAQRQRMGRLWTRLGLKRGVRLLMRPLVVWALFCGAFVMWHLPGPYTWALHNEGIHTIEHLSFFITSLAFWTIVIEPSGRRRIGYGSALLFVTTAAVVTGLAGALMILSPRPLYPEDAQVVVSWGLTLLEDQQLAGLLMWIPMDIVYFATAGWLFVVWLRAPERQVAAIQHQRVYRSLLMASKQGRAFL